MHRAWLATEWGGLRSHLKPLIPSASVLHDPAARSITGWEKLDTRLIEPHHINPISLGYVFLRQLAASTCARCMEIVMTIWLPMRSPSVGRWLHHPSGNAYVWNSWSSDWIQLQAILKTFGPCGHHRSESSRHAEHFPGFEHANMFMDLSLACCTSILAMFSDGCEEFVRRSVGIAV